MGPMRWKWLAVWLRLCGILVLIGIGHWTPVQAAGTTNVTFYADWSNLNLTSSSVVATIGSVRHYWNSGGPCSGRSSCHIDTISLFPYGSQTIESVIAYGKYWNYDLQTKAPWSDNGNTLTSVPRYAQGFCSPRYLGSCHIGRRFMYRNNQNGKLREEIWLFINGYKVSYYYWIYDASTCCSLLESGSDAVSTNRPGGPRGRP